MNIKETFLYKIEFLFIILLYIIYYLFISSQNKKDILLNLHTFC